MSNGGGAVKWKFDSRIDQNTDINTWETDRFVITYNNRPTTLEEYGEDMVMMCVYTGALMYPEMNVDFIDKYFKDRGYKGYLLYDIDKKTGYPKNNPGFHSLEGSKKEMFNLVRDYIQKNGNRDRHIDFLKECLDIRNLQDMTNFDLFTACAGALLGEQSKFSNYLLQDNGGCIDIGSMFKLRSY
jgi:hypothetical protein